MRLAIISDIHANGEALDAVMDSIANKSVDFIICLGDIVNYGVDFEYCIKTIKANVKFCLMGNHDSTVLGHDPLWHMNPEAQKSVSWTMEHLSDKHRSYLEGLEMTFSMKELFFVHATPSDPERWNYITDWYSAAPYFNHFEGKICFVGHSHVPGIYYEGEQKSRYGEGIHDLLADRKVIINVGSVGQPRDRDPKACYVILDDNQQTVEFVREMYDVQTTSQKIAMAGISDFNAQRILTGV